MGFTPPSTVCRYFKGRSQSGQRKAGAGTSGFCVTVVDRIRRGPRPLRGVRASSFTQATRATDWPRHRREIPCSLRSRCPFFERRGLRPKQLPRQSSRRLQPSRAYVVHASRRLDSADVSRARPIAIDVWEIRCRACGLVDHYGGGGKAMTGMLFEKKENHT